jgi:hypothetical protein
MALFNGELTPEWIALLATSGVAGLLDGVTAPGSVFRRGDVDGNGLLDVTDAVASLSFQFLGTFAPPCMDALDFDDNGRIELTDPIGNLTYQFGGGGEPPAPGVETCGPDPTPDEGGELGCENTPASCQ